MAGMMRTVDMTKIAPAAATYGKDLFSVEMWGGSTFGTAYRKLTEDPWKRLDALRKKIPNVMLQMLMRGSNGLGYKYAPDNEVRELIKQAAEGGIDVFRIFDSMNWVPGMEVAIDEVRKQNKIAEASICYSGDILDPNCGSGQAAGIARCPHHRHRRHGRRPQPNGSHHAHLHTQE